MKNEPVSKGGRSSALSAEIASVAGPLVVTSSVVVSGTVAGTITVEPGGELILLGTAASTLVVKFGGAAVVRGRVLGAVVTEGRLVVTGEVRGRLIEGRDALTSVERGATLNGARRL